MREQAIREQRPLITIAFDDRHVTAVNGGREGAVDMQSVCSREELKQVVELFLKISEGRRLKRVKLTK